MFVASINKIIPLSDHHLNKATVGRLLSAQWKTRNYGLFQNNYFPTVKAHMHFLLQLQHIKILPT